MSDGQRGARAEGAPRARTSSFDESLGQAQALLPAGHVQRREARRLGSARIHVGAAVEEERALEANAEATLICAYCTHIIPGKKKVIASLGNSAQKGRLGKAKVLEKAGFPRTCKMCACDPCADIDQRAIRELIDSSG